MLDNCFIFPSGPSTVLCRKFVAKCGSNDEWTCIVYYNLAIGLHFYQCQNCCKWTDTPCQADHIPWNQVLFLCIFWQFIVKTYLIKEGKEGKPAFLNKPENLFLTPIFDQPLKLLSLREEREHLPTTLSVILLETDKLVTLFFAWHVYFPESSQVAFLMT